MIEVYEALAVHIHVEIYDVDMAEIIWPMSDEHDDEGIGLLKEKQTSLQMIRLADGFSTNTLSITGILMISLFPGEK